MASLWFLFCGLVIKLATTVQATNNIESVRGAASHGRCKTFSLQSGKRARIGATVMPSSRLDFLKALAKCGRTGSNSVASRKAARVDAHLVRTKATH